MTLTEGMFGDPEIAGIMGPAARLAAMLETEAVLAEVEAGLGIIPGPAAARIAAVARGLRPDPTAIAAAAAGTGIAAQALVAALKAAAGANEGFVHYGATSQDIEDTALVLQLGRALAVLETRLEALAARLGAAAADTKALVIPARTRFQIAAPTTFGAKIAVWRAPLARHLDRLGELRPRVLNVSLHGAAGTGAALWPQGAEVRRGVAGALGLGAPDLPWHAARDAIAELGGWLALVTGSLGKIGLDLVLLGQSEVGEVAAGTGGGSSTMPQKSNPVAAEALVTLARLNAGDLGTLHQAMIHAQERDGSALGIEWQILPQMLERTGAALRIGGNLAASLAARPERIAARFAADRGAMLAEAVGFLLAREMPRDAALGIVRQALVALAEDPGETLAGALGRLMPGRDWADLLDPARQTGEAAHMVDGATTTRPDSQGEKR